MFCNRHLHFSNYGGDDGSIDDDSDWESARYRMSLWQARRVLSTLLGAVDVGIDESPASTSDFSFASPRKPQTTEPTPTPDHSTENDYVDNATVHPLSPKAGHFCFHSNFGKSGAIFIIFVTVKF